MSLSKLKFKVIPYEMTEKTPMKLNILSIDTSKNLVRGYTCPQYEQYILFHSGEFLYSMRKD